MLLQGAALLVAHHHVHGVMRPEKIQHSNHVGMRNRCQRAALVEEEFHAEPKQFGVLGCDNGCKLTLATFC